MKRGRPFFRMDVHQEKKNVQKQKGVRHLGQVNARIGRLDAGLREKRRPFLPAGARQGKTHAQLVAQASRLRVLPASRRLETKHPGETPG